MGTIRAAVATVAAGALVVLAPAAAFADNGGPTDPLGSVTGPLSGAVNQVQQQLGSLGSSGGPGLPGSPGGPGLPGLPGPSLPSVPGAPSGSSPTTPPSHLPTSSDDDIAPHETKDPSGPDHAGTQGLHTQIAGQDVADAGQNRAAARRDDSTKADSTLLAVGGQEILGAHASSTGKKESHAGNPLQPVCDSSGGQVCLQVLYADAYATNSGGRSHALSRSGLADACVGGTHTDPTAACDGPVHAGVLTDSSHIDRNQRTGTTRAGSRSDLADVCLTQPGTSSSGCTLSAGALHSQGSAGSGGPSAQRGSYLLGVQGGGQGGRVDSPTAIQIPPGCSPPSALCAYLNQGETYLGKHLAGHAQDALTATLLPNQPIEVDALGGHTETLVHQQAGTGGTGRSTGAVSGVSAEGHPATGTVKGESAALTPTAGLLPNTGGPWSGLLALALLALAAGSFLVASAGRASRHSARHLA